MPASHPPCSYRRGPRPRRSSGTGSAPRLLLLKWCCVNTGIQPTAADGARAAGSSKAHDVASRSAEPERHATDPASCRSVCGCAGPRRVSSRTSSFASATPRSASTPRSAAERQSACFGLATPLGSASQLAPVRAPPPSRIVPCQRPPRAAAQKPGRPAPSRPDRTKPSHMHTCSRRSTRAPAACWGPHARCFLCLSLATVVSK